MSAAAFSGYFISRLWGERPIALLVRDANEWQNMTDSFQRNGPAMMVLSRAAPIVPEITACIAGATRMNFCYLFASFLPNGPFKISSIECLISIRFRARLQSPSFTQIN